MVGLPVFLIGLPREQRVKKSQQENDSERPSDGRFRGAPRPPRHSPSFDGPCGGGSAARGLGSYEQLNDSEMAPQAIENAQNGLGDGACRIAGATIACRRSSAAQTRK